MSNLRQKLGDALVIFFAVATTIGLCVLNWQPAYTQITNPGIQQHGAVTIGNCAIWGPGVGEMQDTGGTCSPLAACTTGGLLYYTGGLWTCFNGNTAGTKQLQEDAAGAASWVTPLSSVTIAAGAGIGVTGTCAITSTGTCTVALSMGQLTNSLGADVALNNTGLFFTGPTVAQGAVGTWFASGAVELISTTADTFICKLWDGTTVIAATATSNVANKYNSVPLSGYLASPAGNIRISCQDVSSVNGSMPFNASGTSKDATLSVFRIN